MFDFDADAQALAERCFDYIRDRLSNRPQPVAPPTPKELTDRVGITITPLGIGADRALDIFTDVLAPAAIPLDNPKHAALAARIALINEVRRPRTRATGSASSVRAWRPSPAGCGRGSVGRARSRSES